MRQKQALVEFYRLLSRPSAIAAAFVLGATILSGLMVAVLTLLVDEFIAAAATGAVAQEDPTGIAVCLVVLAMISWISCTNGARLSSRAVQLLFDQMMQAVPASTLQQMEALTTPALLAALTAERDALGLGLSRMLSAARGAAVVCGCLILLIDIQPLFAASLLAVFWLVSAMRARRRGAFRRAIGLARLAEHGYRGTVGHVLAGLRSLKLHLPRHRSLIATGLLPALDRLGMTRLLATLRSTQERCPARYLLPATAAAFAFVGTKLTAGTDITAPAAIALLIGTNFLDAMRATQQLQQAASSLSTVLAVEASLREGADLGEPAPFWPDTISLEDAVYTHNGTDGFRLGPVSFQVTRGETVFVTGGNGSGKTTLIRLITGLYRPQAGRIMCEDEEWEPGALPPLFCAVFNDFHLSREIGVVPTAQLLAFEANLRRFGLHQHTMLQDGVLTNIDLSAGQRRRLALAVALLDDRPFCLFDEWTADQDPEFRELFYKELLPELRAERRGIIVVTHDDRYFDCCDRLVRLEEGRIVLSNDAVMARPAMAHRAWSERDLPDSQPDVIKAPAPQAGRVQVDNDTTYAAIKAFLRESAVRRLLFGVLLHLAGAAAGRTAMGMALGYELFGRVDLIAGSQLLLGYAAGLAGSVRFRDGMDVRLAVLVGEFNAFNQKRVLRRVLTNQAASIEAFGPAKIGAQLNQSDRLLGLFERAAGALAALAATLVSVLGVMLFREPKAGLVALGIIAFVGVIYLINRQILGRRSREFEQAAAAYRHGVSDAVLGFKEMKLNPARTAFRLREALIPASRALGNAQVAFETAASLNMVSAELVFLLAAGGTAAAIVAVVPDGQVSAGVIAICILGLPSTALRALADFMQLRTALAGLDRMLAALRPEPMPPLGQGISPAAAFHCLKLQDITFRQPGGQFVLGPLSCRIDGGSITFVVGGNGSGKSTLMYLLCGLTAPDAGQAYLDGEPVWLPAQRHLFSTVFADVHLFDRLYGLPKSAEATVNAWLDRLGMQGVTRVQDGRFTRLDLSTGQRKRVALAVALAEERPVLLLDEFAADQDPESRRRFYRDILPELRAQGRTIIAISHDDRYFDAADTILRLDYGRLGVALRQ